MKPRHARTASYIAIVTLAVTALAVSIRANKTARDAQATATVARRAAEVPRRPVTVDLSAYDAALYHIELEARRYGQCVELLWYAHNSARRAWPDAPRFEMPASSCPLPAFDKIGSAPEWRGVTMRPGAAVERARKAGRR